MSRHNEVTLCRYNESLDDDIRTATAPPLPSTATIDVDTNSVLNADVADTECFAAFDADDCIYEETPDKRSLFTFQTFAKSLLVVFLITLVGGLLAATVSLAFIYFDLNFLNLCDTTKWRDLPKKLKVVHLFSHCLVDQVFMFWGVVNLCFVFSMKKLKRTVLVLLALLTGCICTIYRLSTYSLNIFATSIWIGMFQHVIFLIVTFAVPFFLLSKKVKKLKERIKLCFTINAQFFMGLLFNILNMFFILPIFLHSNKFHRMLIATLIPILGYICRTTCRHILLSIDGIFHPGNLYILYTCLYATTILFYRILQASVESFEEFMILTCVHALVGCTERISNLYQRHAISFVLHNCRIHKDYDVKRTPKEKRVLADSVVVGVIFEVWGILVTNCMFFLYTLQQMIPLRHGGEFSAPEQLVEFIKRMCYSVAIEVLFVYFTVLVLTIKGNLAMYRVWFHRWRQMTLVLLLNVIFTLFLSSKPLTNLTAQSYHQHLIERGDEGLAKLLFQCNHSRYPY